MDLDTVGVGGKIEVEERLPLEVTWIIMWSRETPGYEPFALHARIQWAI